jgi:hypothetical protein
MIQLHSNDLTLMGLDVHFQFHFEQRLGKCDVGIGLSFGTSSSSSGFPLELAFELELPSCLKGTNLLSRANISIAILWDMSKTSASNLANYSPTMPRIWDSFLTLISGSCNIPKIPQENCSNTNMIYKS